MKKIAKITASVLALAMVLTMTPAKNADAAKKVKIKKVTVESSITKDRKSIVVAKGKAVKLLANVKATPNKAANKKVTFKSNNKKVAVVNKKGIVKGIKAGKTKITVAAVKDSKRKASINVKVVKGAVTKVSLNDNYVEMEAEKKIWLKAKVTAQKGADKTVGWKSSNEDVATVNQRGVVTPIGGGTATITAIAADGSGKKATCRVSVPGDVGVVTVTVVNPHTIRFMLSSALPLGENDIRVEIKKYYRGLYQKKLFAAYKSFTTTDNRTYTIVLKDEYYINPGDCVKVENLNFPGKKSCENIYVPTEAAYKSEKVSTWTVNQYGSEIFSFDEAYGYQTLSMTSLPQGLTYVNKGDYIVVKGTPLVPGVVTVTFNASDEWCNSYTETIKFIIGSEANVVAAATETYYMTGETIYDGATQKIYATGGSGNYKYTVISDPSGIVENKNDAGVLVNLSESEEMEGVVAFKQGAAGRYEVTVRVTDEKDAKKYADVIMYVNIAQSITVSGYIKDLEGKGITDGFIMFENTDRANKYCDVQYAYVDYNGMYVARLVPGTYNIIASNGSVLGLLGDNEKHFAYDAKFDVSTTYDVSLAVRKVDMTSMTDELMETVSWYCDGDYIGMGNVVYMKQGNHVLEATAEDSVLSNGQYFNCTYKYVANVAVTATGVDVKVNKIETSRVRASASKN